MKSKGLKIFTFVVFFAVLCLMFVFVGYVYLSVGTQSTEEKDYGQSYVYSPENCGVFVTTDYCNALFYLDFRNNEIKSFFVDGSFTTGDTCCGYKVDFFIKGNGLFLSQAVDALGGIDIVTDNTLLHYGGEAVTDALEAGQVKNSDLIRSVFEAIIRKIAQNGITRDNIITALKYADTDLTVPDFYYWPEYLPAAAGYYKNQT